MEEEETQIFMLYEDALLEIFQYLSEKDMKSLSLTSQWGYNITKDYFGKRSKLSFSKSLTMEELRAVTSSSRNYKEVVVSLNNFSEIIFKQLKKSNTNITGVRLDIEKGTHIKKIQQQILYFRKHFESQKVILHSKDCISSFLDILNYRQAGVCIQDFTSIGIYFKYFDSLFIESFMHYFRGLESLDVYAADNLDSRKSMRRAKDFKLSLNIKTVMFHGKISKELNFLRLFHGIETLIIKENLDEHFLVNMIHFNKDTLRTLHLISVVPYEQPEYERKLEIGYAFSNYMITINSKKKNSNKLKLLKYILSNTRPFKKMFFKPPCSQDENPLNSPMLRHFIIKHPNLGDILTRTRHRNAETLEIEIINELLNKRKGMHLKYRYRIDQFFNNPTLRNELYALTYNIPRVYFKSRKLFEAFPNVTFFEGSCTSSKQFLAILKELPKLEIFKGHVNLKNFSKAIRYVDLMNFSRYNLRYVTFITQVRDKAQLDMIQLDENRVFAMNSIAEEELNLVDIMCEVDVRTKNFRRSFSKRSSDENIIIPSKRIKHENA